LSRGDTALDRILSALNHPIRRRILRALVEGPGSASTLSRAFEMELGVVSYHLNKVLSTECGVIELVDAVPRRGALEKFYRLKPDAWADLPSVTQPAEASGGMRRMPLGECLLEAVEAMEGETFASLEGRAWEWFPLEVDNRAWKEILEARQEFNKRIEVAVEEGRKRAEGRKGSAKRHEIVVGAVAFPAARSVADA
jgi:DNA-binding transcriptional ArsR family regulator